MPCKNPYGRGTKAYGPNMPRYVNYIFVGPFKDVVHQPMASVYSSWVLIPDTHSVSLSNEKWMQNEIPLKQAIEACGIDPEVLKNALQKP